MNYFYNYYYFVINIVVVVVVVVVVAVVVDDDTYWFTCPSTIHFKFLTKCDKCHYKVRQLFLLQSAMVCYYKVRQFFYYKVRQVLLQSATGITKCYNFITKCDRYYKVRRLLQSATVHVLMASESIAHSTPGSRNNC